MNLPHSPELRRTNESARNAALDSIRAAVAPTPLKETLARSVPRKLYASMTASRPMQLPKPSRTARSTRIWRRCMESKLGTCDVCYEDNLTLTQNDTEVFWMGKDNAPKRCPECEEKFHDGPMRDEPPDETPGIVEQANAAWTFRENLRRSGRVR